MFRHFHKVKNTITGVNPGVLATAQTKTKAAVLLKSDTVPKPSKPRYSLPAQFTSRTMQAFSRVFTPANVRRAIFGAVWNVGPEFWPRFLAAP